MAGHEICERRTTRETAPQTGLDELAVQLARQVVGVGLQGAGQQDVAGQEIVERGAQVEEGVQT